MKYTITEVKTQETWENKYGKTMRSYAIRLDGVQSWVKLNQLVATDPPQPGAVIQGDIIPKESTNGKKYYQFKKEYSGGYSTPENVQIVSQPDDNARLERIEKMLEMLVENITGTAYQEREKIDDPFSDL